MTGPALVVVTGIDGTGKTTQANMLAERLRERGLDARCEHAFGPNARLTRALKDRVAPRFHDAEDELAREGRTTSGGNRLLGLVFLARGIWGVWTAVLANARADVLVLDRYLYDDLARVGWRYGYDGPSMLRLIGLVPAPDLTVRLDAPAEVVWEREADGRTTLAEHAEKGRWYDAILDAVAERREVVTVDTHENDVAAAHERIVELVDERALGGSRAAVARGR